MGRLHTSIKRQTEQNVATLGVSLVVLGPPWRPLSPCMCNMPTLDWHEVGRSKKTAQQRDISMRGLHTSTKRMTKQKAATLGVSLVVLGLLWGFLWP